MLVAALFFLSACQQHSPHFNTYYITTQGNDTHSGLNQNKAWSSFKHALEVVKPGDTVYIKAGHYTDNNLYVGYISGTKQSPISFIGYYQSPGDIKPKTFDPHQSITPEIPSSDLFPTLDGEFKDDHYSGIEINNNNYIHLKNLHVTGYQSNISLYEADHNLLHNMIVSKAEDSVAHNGFGLTLKNSNHNTLQYILAISNQGENISFQQSNYNALEDCQSHGGLPDDDKGQKDGTDYYIVIAQSHHNTISKCLAQRHSPVKHGGHGIGIKAKGIDSYNNTITDSVIRGMSKGFYVNHHQTFNNEFINCTTYGDEAMSGLTTRGFIVRDGAHHNTFRKCKGEALDFAFALYDSHEDGGYKQEQNNNLFTQCELTNTMQSIIFFEHDAKNNVFDKMVINEAPRLIMTASNMQEDSNAWTGNILKNSQLINVHEIGLVSQPNSGHNALNIQNINYSIQEKPAQQPDQ